MRLVIKIGGSISIDENGPIYSYFQRLIPVLKDISKSNQTVIAIGGGKFLRKYFNAIKNLGLKNEEMEWIAVELLKVNVKFLSMLLNKKPVYKLEKLTPECDGVIGGIKPGRSTDANAAYAASIIDADYLIKLTNVDGVYEEDPKQNTNAKKIDNLSFSELENFSVKGKPGSYGILDSLAIKTISDNKIKTVIMHGDPENLINFMKGEKIGTLIS